PLAALSAVMELSGSPEFVLPAILVIVPAYVTATQFFANRSIFIRQLDYQKLPYTLSSVTESLQKTGVLAVMDTEIILLKHKKESLLPKFTHAEHKTVVYKSSVENKIEYALVDYDKGQNGDAIRMTLIPMTAVKFQATLAEVYAILSASRDGTVYICSHTTDDIIGIITWKTLSHYLHQASY
ncbi:MAG: chloride channel protein, partial [Paraglaciecola sp.]|nr:chloride channel protein [Paraglaciecola sp.]